MPVNAGARGQQMPVAFVAHGAGPLPVLRPETQGNLDKHLKSFGKQVAAAKPSAILVVSAHHQADQVIISGDADPGLLYDYYGFQPEAYELKYTVPGAPKLANTIKSLLQSHGIAAQVNHGRGLDHGVFVPLLLMLPDASIPVVSMSLVSTLDPEHHLHVGRALQPLRERGVLILGSGMSYHNMRGFDRSMPHGLSGPAGRDSVTFHHWLTPAVCKSSPQDRTAKLTAWASAPAARECHPTQAEEHLMPLHVCAGAAGNDAGRQVYDGIIGGAQVASYMFGSWPVQES